MKGLLQEGKHEAKKLSKACGVLWLTYFVLSVC